MHHPPHSNPLKHLKHPFALEHTQRRIFMRYCSALAWGASAWGQGWAQNPNPPLSQTPTTTVLVVGDSLSAEYGLPRKTGWVALLEQRLQAQALSAEVINASISGDTTAGGKSRLPGLLQKHRPTHVVIELGGNDALRGLPLTTTETHLSHMIEAAQKSAAKVTLLGMQVPPNYGSVYARDFQQLYEQLTTKHRVALVPFFLKNVADVPHAIELFQADRIHPNEKAQHLMLDNVWPVLRSQLKKP
jgi:acyl-CoA thioesterase-1